VCASARARVFSHTHHVLSHSYVYLCLGPCVCVCARALDTFTTEGGSNVLAVCGSMETMLEVGLDRLLVQEDGGRKKVGGNAGPLSGCEEVLRVRDYDVVAVAGGTGGTLAGRC
jgi:hypothetical protein